MKRPNRRAFFTFAIPVKPWVVYTAREEMYGEWKLRDDAPPSVINRTRRLVLVGVFGMLLICGVAFAVVVRAKTSQNQPHPYAPNKPSGLKLFDGRVTFAINSIQTVELRLPCSGLLTVSLTFPKGTALCAFLVPPEELEKMKTRQTFKHVEGFDAKTTSGSCQQAAEVAPGRYSLVLVDESMSRGVVQVRANLSDLK
jgi:hypothetical protein